MSAFARYLDDSEAAGLMQSAVLSQTAKLAAEAAAKNNEPTPTKLKIVRDSRTEVQNETDTTHK